MEMRCFVAIALLDNKPIIAHDGLQIGLVTLRQDRSRVGLAIEHRKCAPKFIDAHVFYCNEIGL